MTDVLLTAYLTALAADDLDTAREVVSLASDPEAVDALLADDDDDPDDDEDDLRESVSPAPTPEWWGDEPDADADGEPVWPDEEAPLDDDDPDATPVDPATRESAGKGRTGEFRDRRGRRMCFADGKRVPCKQEPKPAGGYDRFADNTDHPPYQGTGEPWDVPSWVPAGKTADGRLRWMHASSGRVATGDRPPEPSPKRKQEAYQTRRERLAQPAATTTTPEARPYAERLYGEAGGDGVVTTLRPPNGTQVHVLPGYAGSGLQVYLYHPDVDSWSRTIFPQMDGTLMVSNNLFFLKPGARGSGMGTKAFTDQVQGMVAEGGTTIRTTAGKGGRGGEKMNGYYTWARLGYDAELSAAARRGLPPGLEDATTVQDLMATPEGAAWWRRNGYMTQMEFDTRPESRSIAVLNGYLRSKGAAPVDDGPAVVQAREAAIAARRERLAQPAPAPTRAPTPTPPPPPPAAKTTAGDPGEAAERRRRMTTSLAKSDVYEAQSLGLRIADAAGLNWRTIERAVIDTHLPLSIEDPVAAMGVGYFRAMTAAGLPADRYLELHRSITAARNRG